MPRVRINKKKYQLKDLKEWMMGRMKTLEKTQADMGKLIDMNQASFGKRLNESNFTYGQLLVILKELQATDEEILRFMKM